MQISKVNIDDLSTIRVINDGAIPAVNSVSDEEFIWFHKNNYHIFGFKYHSFVNILINIYYFSATLIAKISQP